MATPDSRGLRRRWEAFVNLDGSAEAIRLQPLVTHSVCRRFSPLNSLEVVMNVKRASAAVAATTALLLLGLAEPASADVANANAACPGLGLSDHAVHDGPGAISGIIADIKGGAEFFGFSNLGQVMSRFAHAHPGTHVPGCEDAITDIFEAGP